MVRGVAGVEGQVLLRPIPEGELADGRDEPGRAAANGDAEVAAEVGPFEVGLSGECDRQQQLVLPGGEGGESDGGDGLIHPPARCGVTYRLTVEGDLHRLGVLHGKRWWIDGDIAGESEAKLKLSDDRCRTS